MGETTEMQIQGYSGIAENCVGKAKVSIELGSRIFDEDIFLATWQYQITCQNV